MTRQIRMAVRGFLGGVALVALWVGPALAMTGSGALQQTQQQIGSAVPEPGAALLFAAGAGAVAWSLRRRAAR